MRDAEHYPSPLPRVVVEGTAIERGRQYGAQARVRIHRSIGHYRALFAHRAGLDWPSAVARAAGYKRDIGRFAPQCLEEMAGIAEGAGVGLGDILALNARSELMFTAAARKAAAPGLAGECTSFAVLPEASELGHTIVGQNWDWLPFACDTAMILEVHRDDGPNFLSILEAGHLAKIGVNAAGLAVCTNTLVSLADDGRQGVPYHVLLRVLLDAETMTEALRTLYAARRAFSGNYLIAHADGLAADVETIAGGASGVHVVMPEGGLLAHANHFLSPAFARLDARLATHPNTLFRADALGRALGKAAPAVGLEHLKAALRGHLNHPDGVCSHPDERAHPLERRATIMSMIADLNEGCIWLTPGPPCASDYRPYAYRAALERTLETADTP
ncbi:MAG: C45 family autoproteolytic acyltransferase/hydrolase [Alphaproteobacteria bacterium]